MVDLPDPGRPHDGSVWPALALEETSLTTFWARCVAERDIVDVTDRRRFGAASSRASHRRRGFVDQLKKSREGRDLLVYTHDEA